MTPPAPGAAAHLDDGAAVAFGVVDVEGDEILALDAGAALVVDPHVFAFEAQLEELALGDGDLHLGVLAVHLRLDDVVLTCRTHSHEAQVCLAGVDAVTRRELHLQGWWAAPDSRTGRLRSPTRR